MAHDSMPVSSPHDRTALRSAIFVGVFITTWNFILMFRGWVVASQAELLGANIFFLFLGVVPWIGLIASACRSQTGPLILICSPIVALAGLFFTKNDEWQTVLLAMLITVGPALAIGLVLRNLLRRPDKAAGNDLA